MGDEEEEPVPFDNEEEPLDDEEEGVGGTGTTPPPAPLLPLSLLPPPAAEPPRSSSESGATGAGECDAATLCDREGARECVLEGVVVAVGVRVRVGHGSVSWVSERARTPTCRC
jgi:hypothetical protein